MNAAEPGPERAFDTDEARWQAVSSRQASADGSFVYAVATTGVYCRPSCAARAARQENVSFHRTPAEAEAAGFRACKRCRPAGRSPAELRAEAVARACRLIDEAEEPPSLDDLARAAGVSRFYFHRVFKEIVGVTPKAYAAARRRARVQSELRDAPNVTAAIYGAGYNASSRFYVIIGGVVFGVFAGYNYWFPKAFGFTLDERLGKASFWCWLIGFYIAFTPLYALGMMGMTRRLQHIPEPSWQPLLLVAEAGAIVIFVGVLCQIAQLYVSIRTRESRRDLTGDPWNGRTLEWSTASPPPAYNYAVLPQVETIDAFWEMKQRGVSAVEKAYESIHMPRNSPIGFIIAFFAVVTGFALIWHIWWMAILGLLAAAVTVLVSGWSDEREREIPATEVAQMERAGAA